MNLSQQLATGREKVAFRVSMENNGSISHINLDLVYVGAMNQIEFYDNYYDQKHQYRGLSIKSQLCESFHEPYGYELVVSGNSFGITLSVANRITKVLSPIERKLQKLEKSYGSVYSFEDYVMRVAEVMGVKAFFTNHGSKRNVYNPEMAELIPLIRTLVDYHKRNVLCLAG